VAGQGYFSRTRSQGLILILTPIKEENQALARFLVRQPGVVVEEMTLGRIPARRFPSLGLLLACGGLGKAQFALQAQHLVDQCPEISTLVCAGAGGSLAEGVRAGEVVVATETVEHDAIYKFARRPLPRFSGDEQLVARLREAAAGAPFKVHFGAVASGDEDVADRQRAGEIRRKTGALAVAWEGAGGARVARFNALPYLELRGITDSATPLALASFIFYLGRVMERIGWLALRLRE